MNIPGLHRKLVLAHTTHGDVNRTYWVKDHEPAPSHMGGGEPLRFSSGERQRVKEPTAHPRENIKISYGMIFAKDANRAVDQAIHQIGQVHAIPKSLRPIGVNVTGSCGGANGLYQLYNPEIRVSKYAMGPAGTMAHEYGHFLDHQLFGSGRPGMGGLATSKRSTELAPLMNAIYKSQAVKQVAGRHGDFQKQGHYGGQQACQYLLMPAELFARSYAQYIGARTGGAVRTDVRRSGDEWRRLGNLHAQWDDKDFEPIAREFDRLFARRGLLRQTRRSA